jgi:toxin ParE1/3/4
VTRYRIPENAELDLDDIFLYWVRRAGPQAAERLIDSIAGRFWLLAEHPVAGRPSDEIAAGVKCFPAGKYLIYYRRTRRGTEILHILHSDRDQKRAFPGAR